MSRISIPVSPRTLRNLAIAVAVLALFSAVNSVFAAPACSDGFTDDCLYLPPTVVSFNLSPNVDVTYIDVTTQSRTISIILREPVGAPEPMPIVVWSHGGASGKTNPRKSMGAWSDLTASMGYFTVSIAHHARNSASQADLCLAIGIPDPADCALFKYLNWDRPHDISAVLDELEGLALTPELEGRLDLSRIAIGGHSAGAGGTMSVAGAKRRLGASTVQSVDNRPVAFLAFSPQGPGSEGFFESDFRKATTSWIDIKRPVLIGTGAGDNTCKPSIWDCDNGDSPSYRKIPFDLMPPGDKYRLFIDDSDAFHSMFSLATDKCISKGVDPAKCLDFTDWISSAGIAFLDAHLRDDALAALWLQSDNLVTAGDGDIQWDRK